MPGHRKRLSLKPAADGGLLGLARSGAMSEATQHRIDGRPADRGREEARGSVNAVKPPAPADAK